MLAVVPLWHQMTTASDFYADIQTRQDLALLVPEGGQFVELGVAAGRFADQVLTRNGSIRYTGIDKWDDHHDLAEMDQAWRRINQHGKAHQLIRMRFDQALASFADSSIDVLYIDGYAHTGQEGGSTLRDWWPKVKDGGVIGGHDYTPHYQPTIDSVDAFVADLRDNGQDVELRIISESPYDSWFIVKGGA